MRDMLPYLAAIIAAVGGIATTVTAWRLAKDKAHRERSEAELAKEQTRGAQQIAGVEASVGSLQAALAQANLDNRQLRADLIALRDEWLAHKNYCTITIHRLSRQIVGYGGVPALGDNL